MFVTGHDLDAFTAENPTSARHWTAVQFGHGCLRRCLGTAGHISVANRPAHLWQAPDKGEVHIRLERDGTCIWLRGSASREEAVSAALSLQPVEPTNPAEG